MGIWLQFLQTFSISSLLAYTIFDTFLADEAGKIPSIKQCYWLAWVPETMRD